VFHENREYEKNKVYITFHFLWMKKKPSVAEPHHFDAAPAPAREMISGPYFSGPGSGSATLE
jgi:hypothetical protein